jgi:hypothetical protein
MLLEAQIQFTDDDATAGELESWNSFRFDKYVTYKSLYAILNSMY